MPSPHARIAPAALLSLALGACAHVRTEPPASQPAPAPIALAVRAVAAADVPLDDDLPLPPLLDAVERHAGHIEKLARITELRLGDRVVAKAEYVAALRRFVALGREAPTREAFHAAVLREFDWFELTGPDPVKVTAYYEPVIPGARRPTERFTQPLYRKPPELTSAPYLTRAEIDSGRKLQGRGLELCWVDPFHAFVIQTEGSGAVSLDDGGLLRLDFAATNGQPHERLGKHLVHAIPVERMNLHTMEAYLRSLPEVEMRVYLEKNPRYVFFQERRGDGAATSIGLPAVAGRTIATDPQYVPKGGLAFLSTEKPRFEGADPLAPTGWEPLRRFVLDQDTGGGIKGARVDLFWGSGDEAGRHAGVMKQPGRLFYLAPRARR